MKRERYFRDELQRLFIGYAILPAALFTLVCGLVFLTALLYGRSSLSKQHNDEAAVRLERILKGYEQGLNEMASVLVLPEESSMDGDKRSRAFEAFYRISNELGYEAGFYVLDQERQLLLSNRKEAPEYLKVPDMAKWGIFYCMDENPGQPVVRLLNGWKPERGDIVLGMKGEKGYLIFSIDKSCLLEAASGENSQTLVADSFGWVFLEGNGNFLTESSQLAPDVRGADRFFHYKGNLFLICSRKIYGGLFEVFTVSDIQNILVSLSIGSTLVITALVLMTCWVRMSTKKVTERKTRDLYKVLDAMESAREGKLDSVLSIDSKNEFYIIANAYNETMASLRRQMENNRKMAELVAASQNKQLESQFNPHFLYNTLENIRYMCKLEPATAERMVFSLSNLLRYSLDGSREEVTLKEDLEHLTNYLNILERRFGSRFEYALDVDEGALTCKVPKLMLQPMIENAVKYGFGNQLNLKVELSAYIHEEKLIMICRDDGVGMSQTTLSELTALLEQKENTSRHSGLYNIHRRIRLLYGTPYGVEIRSTEGHGTMLVVTLPVREQEGA